MNSFTLQSNGTVPKGNDPKLVRMGLAFTLEPLEAISLELLRLFYFGSAEGAVPVGQNQIEPNQKRTGLKMRDDSYVCFIILRAKYQRKLDFSD